MVKFMEDGVAFALQYALPGQLDHLSLYFVAILIVFCKVESITLRKEIWTTLRQPRVRHAIVT